MRETAALLALAFLALRRSETEGQTQEQARPREPKLDGKTIEIPVRGIIRDRLGAPRSHGPHQGIDIAAPAGSIVRAWGAGKVTRVVDGRKSDRESARRAGLWVDVLGDDGNTHRYLHLGRAAVSTGAYVRRGDEIGTVEKDHLHFEVRSGQTAYGTPLDPTI